MDYVLQVALKILYLKDPTIEEVFAKSRSEVLHSYNFYSEVSYNEFNILTVLNNQESLEIL